jgi:NAD(P)-dependent dehydrogenase (short-subunit alcohol dehydrogenase family)
MSKTVLITGAATGIGRETALRFATEGWNVVATTRRPGSIPTEDLPPGMHAVEMDVTQSEQVQTAIDAAVAEFGGIDVVVNNAGFGEFGLFEGISPEKVRASFEVNVFGVMNVMRAALPHFRSRQAGVFVNISSAGGIIGMPAMSVYLTTKFALEGFSESAWFELASQGVAVKLIEPGGVETPFLSKIANIRQRNPPPEDYAAFVAHNDKVMSQLGWPRSTPIEIAEIVFGAATDGTSKLRYFAGPGVEHMVSARHTFDDERYEIYMRAEFDALSKLPDLV